MPKYTYKDIIIDPTSEEAKNCIGKEVYCADSPHYCLEKANGNEVDHTVYILQSIIPDNNYPFRLGKNAEYEHCCIIHKKEESQKDEHKKYVPFSNKEEFLSAYEEHTKSMKKYGIWIFNKKKEIDNIIPCLITEMWSNGLIIGGAAVRTLWKYILEGFVFEDGTPCGNEINIKKEDEIIDD